MPLARAFPTDMPARSIHTPSPRTRWLSRLLFASLFVLGGGALLYHLLGDYRHASAILHDHSVATVPVIADGAFGVHTEPLVHYRFHYVFESKGRLHRGTFEASGAEAAPLLLDGATVEIAYANADPSRFGRLDQLQHAGNLGSVLTRLAIALSIAALLAAAAHQLLIGRVLGMRRAAVA
ncbi:hypothetical protein KFS84_01435 [Xanthomonas translucens pv. graminis]|jgi:hypothetical protein|uniref:DUF3592 domain-containing protein n=2 Tax=Xanthomonas translucens group TaxID=3390202 RepID=A0A1M4KZD6_9XANT|nr:hypothetical protein XTG29_00231 [Xanthomonas translucens pv. graminis ART-Xtg29]OAX63126.1 hypothetical protein A6R72_07250 [Xanthomonas translucens pv. graminis]UKE54648.1 hypothetical protein KFS84_01435 [Xanthomonas translucens pv. graminis]WIH09035.1 hypothetical protein KM579_02100 [Xanthomonas translucens pv. graminis]WIH12523.1 hypothetical protein KM563_01120 [Xanthomonas translucens pv. graminis]